MPIIFDITKDSLYQEGLEQGLEKGLEQGLEKGSEKKEREIIINALRKGTFTVDQIAEIVNVDIEVVLSIKDELRLD